MRKPAAGAYETQRCYAGYKYGPSSRHPGIVNHLFADGSMHGVSETIDVSVYMAILTKSNGETVDQSAAF